MNNHFAELGDVWKHLPLAEILRINPPRQYWETHAGLGVVRADRDPVEASWGSSISLVRSLRSGPP